MKPVLTLSLAFFIALCMVTDLVCLPDEYFTRDPAAVYDKTYESIDLIIEIPGYKLDAKSALSIPLEKEDYEYAQGIHQDILMKARQYVAYRNISEDGQYAIYAANDLGEYILLYFDEQEIRDGGFQLVYSKKLKRIIGSFSSGYKG